MLVRVGAETVSTAVPAIPPVLALIVVLPAANAVAIPVLEIDATAGVELDQVTAEVQFEFVPFE